jgi:hypothetical protein
LKIKISVLFEGQKFNNGESIIVYFFKLSFFYYYRPSNSSQEAIRDRERIYKFFFVDILILNSPKKEKCFSEKLGSYHPVRLLISPSGDYESQVRINKTKTVKESKLDLENINDLKVVIEKLSSDSGYVMCPGIVDFDIIEKDIHIVCKGRAVAVGS